MLIFPKNSSIFLMFFLTVFQACAQESYPERERKILSQVKCPTCLGQSVKESSTPAAQHIRSFVSQSIREGLSDNEILDEIREGYGEDICFAPQFGNHTYILWAAPLLTALFLIILFRKKLRW